MKKTPEVNKLKKYMLLAKTQNDAGGKILKQNQKYLKLIYNSWSKNVVTIEGQRLKSKSSLIITSSNYNNRMCYLS